MECYERAIETKGELDPDAETFVEMRREGDGKDLPGNTSRPRDPRMADQYDVGKEAAICLWQLYVKAGNSDMANKLVEQHLTFNYEEPGAWGCVSGVRHPSAGEDLEPGSEGGADHVYRGSAGSRDSVGLGDNPMIPAVQAVMADTLPHRRGDGVFDWGGYAWAGHSAEWAAADELKFGRIPAAAAGMTARSMAVPFKDRDRSAAGTGVGPRSGAGWHSWFAPAGKAGAAGLAAMLPVEGDDSLPSHAALGSD